MYLGLAGVHGGEFEGIAGMVNLIAVLETGKDLRGKEWPEINAAAKGLDRIILIPIANVDGRARVPLRMESFQGKNETLHEYMNTGAGLDGKNIGWPQCKEFIPLDFSKTQFPGGYPNDAAAVSRCPDGASVRKDLIPIRLNYIRICMPDMEPGDLVIVDKKPLICQKES